ncbi:MAG: TrmH family RNA methyltransferase [Clostridia bacterium]|nr:TrmH family RNA methyltransferase [Clostridia bacterium]
MSNYKNYKTEIIKPYKKEHETSYTCGAFATIELLRARPELLRKVFIHSAFTDSDNLAGECARLGIPVARGDEAFRRIMQKENVYAAGVFDKFEDPPRPDRAHIVLDSPADMGNLGTILRTAAAVNITNVAIIGTAADIFHPKTIRASMGALFRLRFAVYGSFGEYRQAFPRHECYPFMLGGEALLAVLEGAGNPLFALIFGNEARGLSPEYAAAGRAVRIPQSALVDSLNLPVAVGVGAYAFANKYGLV